ncbi:suppressor of tub2 mutation [Apophysomyces sp. BC1021]|nr:suppressor of tub2 mutation [Apophysomyces sp. BC1021]
MTVKEEADKTDVDAVQIWSPKGLQEEFASMIEAYRDKETEHNWEARERYITRLRGILRGNSVEKYPDVLTAGIRQMVDGILKAVESLRTTLASNALSLVADIGIYASKGLDNYMYDHFLNCLIKCASMTKKIIASASMNTTITFIRHTRYYPKIMNMLWLTMNEKNNQARLHTVIYTKTVLQTHAHQDHTRASMDRSNGTDILENILKKGLTDATPAVREACREAFWIFLEYWKERGEALLKTLPPASRKVLEKAKTSAPKSRHDRNMYSPTNSSSSLRTSSSLGSHRNISDVHEAVSPSTSSASNGSTGSTEHHPPVHEVSRSMTRSVSPRSSSPSIRSTSPHLLRSYGSPPPIPSHLHTSYLPPTSPPPPTATRKTRVPALSKKKSTIGLNTKRKPNLLSMLKSDDLNLQWDGLHMLARKLTQVAYDPHLDVSQINIDTGNGTTNGKELASLIWEMFLEDNVRLYEAFSTWEATAGILLKLISFEEYVPRLILDACETSLRTEDDKAKVRHANLTLKRVKLFLTRHDPDLADRLLANLMVVGGFGDVAPKRPSVINKKDPMRSHTNRRQLTKQFLEWMDELVVPMIGLEVAPEEEIEESEWLGIGTENVASRWFEADAHVKLCLLRLLPLVSTSLPGSMWHGPLVSLVGHLRLVNQKLFEAMVATFDEQTVNKTCRALGVHIRPVTDYVCQAAPAEMHDDSAYDIPVTKEERLSDEKEHAEEVTHEEKDNLSHFSDNTTPEIEIHPYVEDRISNTIEENSSYSDETSPYVKKSIITSEQHTEKVTVHEEEEEEEEEEVVVEEETVQYVEKVTVSHEDVITRTNAKEEVAVDTDSQINQPPKEDRHDSIQDSVESDNSLLYETENKPSAAVEEETYESEGPASTLDDPIRSFSNQMEFHDMTIPVAQPYEAGEKEPVNRDEVLLGCEKMMDEILDDDMSDMVIENNVRRLSNVSDTITVDITPPRVDISLIKSVPYFAPKEQTSEGLAVFKENKRNPPNVSARSGGKDRTTALYGLIDKMNAMAADNNTFRKMIRLCKEAPVLKRWDQGGSEEAGGELWAGGNLDGGNFVEVAQSTLLYLGPTNTTHTAAAMELVQQLSNTQAGLFRFYERKICTTAEDALDAVLGALDSQTVFEILLSYLIYRLILSPTHTSSSDAWGASRYHPIGSAFTYLGKWVKEVNDINFINDWLNHGGIETFLKGMNDPFINIRKSCVEAIVAFQEVLGDDMYRLLGDNLRVDQINLVRHYAAKSLKKKASLRNLSATGQLR